MTGFDIEIFKTGAAKSLGKARPALGSGDPASIEGRLYH
jgi:hypothetical protein